MPRKDPAERKAYAHAHYMKLKAEGSPQIAALRARTKAYYEANAERLKAESRARYAAKKAAGELPYTYTDRMRVNHRAWCAANPERCRAIVARRRARLRGVDATLTPDEWLERLDEYGGHCAYCLTAPATDMEHMTPLSRGGRHELENVVPACGPCNTRKATRTLLETLQAA